MHRNGVPRIPMKTDRSDLRPVALAMPPAAPHGMTQSQNIWP